MAENQYIEVRPQKGSRMNFNLISVFNDENKVWETTGVASFGISYDLEHWGDREEKARAYDDDIMFSVAVVMRSLSESVYSEEFQNKLKELASEHSQE